MDGYVKNMTHLWAYTMKRSVGPGEQIPLSELYDQYGVRHNLEKGDEFIQWLKDVKLRDNNKWQIFLENDKPISPEPEKPKEEEVQGATVVKTDKSRGDNVAPPVVSDMDVDDVVGLSVRKARDIVPTIQDVQLLKYAEKVASQRTGKDSLRRILMKRIEELSVSTRR